ncbi:Developmental and secondary metabolism regulator veA [Rhizoctonia solani]|uniref:Developmental and secondary metabolism regulator veA n=1 Tax=Rhizoctonia solani TaxID=456999 RepID=A0A8H7HAM6_9AGAM|nr:Developmental and secondary metabolism regulator veA [Rhizoctonia solani]
MLVTRQDDTVVDADDIDIAFFLVTVDLWSESGTEEMNLVLHPSSGGHATSSYPNRRTKRPPTTAYSAPPPSHYDTQSSTPAPAPTGYPPRHEGTYPPRGPEENAGYPQRPDAAYGGPRPEGAGYTGRPDDSHTQTQYANAYEDPRGNWPPHYPPPAGPSGGSTAPPGPAADHSQYQTLPPIGSIMASPSPNPQHAPHPHSHPHSHQRPYPPPAPAPGQWNYGSQNPAYIDPALQQPPHMQPPHGQPPPVPAPGPAYSEEGVYPSNAPGASYYVQTPAALHGAATTQHDGSSATNGQYTRTLVGPLSANASRLVDAENQPGIFFLFQDLSVRTEGTFRLRMRLMNVGAHPAPNAHATHVTTTSAPVLAQTFTDPFTVYSAKRFPGVPETTPLSVAFGTQGQKLPLRNRNPGTSSKKGGRKNRGNGSDSEGDSEGGDSDDSRGTG